MSTSNWITVLGILAATFVTWVGSVWHLSYQIGGLTEKVVSVERTVEKLDERTLQMRGDIREIRVKVDVLWEDHVARSASSNSLDAAAAEILAKSGIGSFAEQHFPDILSKVKRLKPRNVDQVQKLLIVVVNQYKKDEAYKLKLRAVASSSGYDVDSLLLVAALSIKDRVIEELGFNERAKPQ